MGVLPCNAGGFGVLSADIRYLGAGVHKILYDPSVFVIGPDAIWTIVLHTSDPSATGPFGLGLSAIPRPLMVPPPLVLPQSFVFFCSGGSSFPVTVNSFDDHAILGAGVTFTFGAQTPPPDVGTVAGTFVPCYIWGGQACPRVDAWIRGAWVEVGRAIRYCRGIEREGVYRIFPQEPASRFRIVEDEPEISTVRYIRGDGELWDRGELRMNPGDSVEFCFPRPVHILETCGYYALVQEPACVSGR